MPTVLWLRSVARALGFAGWIGVASAPAAGQTVSCEPVSARAGREFGCFITAREELGELASEPPLYWQVDTYSTRSAAEEAKGPRRTAVESLGQIWLFTIADSGWRPAAGRRVAEKTLATDWVPQGLCEH